MSVDFLVTGGGGMLAWAVKRELAARGHTFQAPTRAELDVTDEAAVHDVIRRLEPRVIIQCAAYTRVDDAESHEDEAYRVNALGTKFVAEAAREVGARFVFPSTDYVFDGTATRPYRPEDEPNPINAYGRTKLAGEINARLAPEHLIIRMSWLYGPGGRNFVRTIVEKLERGEAVRVVNDQFGRPTWTIDAAHALVELIESEAGTGAYHWANAGVASWYDVATEIAVQRQGSRIGHCTSRDVSGAASRPAYSVLGTDVSEQLLGCAAEWRIALRRALETGRF